MECPFCGGEMEQGVLYTENSRGLYFLPLEDTLGFWITRRGVEKGGGIVLDGPYNGNFPNCTELGGFVCRACRRIIVQYED